MATSSVYGSALRSLLNGEIDLDGVAAGGLKVMLCDSDYTPNLITHRYKSQVTGEVSGNGYTAGGLALTGVTVKYDARKVVTLDAADPRWPEGSDFVARYAVFYYAVPATDDKRPLLCVWDFGEDLSTDGVPFILYLNAGGLLSLAAG